MVIQIILALYSLWTYGIGKYPLFFGKLADICVCGNDHVNVANVIKRISIAVVFQQIFFTRKKTGWYRIQIYIQVNSLEMIESVIQQRSSVRESTVG